MTKTSHTNSSSIEVDFQHVPSLVHKMVQPMRPFFENESGATAPEYCFVGAMIIAVCVLGIAIFGDRVAELFWNSNVSMSDAFRR